MADLGVGDLSRADCLSGVAHLMDGTLERSVSEADVLCTLSATVTKKVVSA